MLCLNQIIWIKHVGYIFSLEVIYFPIILGNTTLMGTIFMHMLRVVDYVIVNVLFILDYGMHIIFPIV